MIQKKEHLQIALVLIVVTIIRQGTGLVFPFPKRLSHSFTGRGYTTKYGAVNNSTIPGPREVAAKIGVRPALEAPSQVWKFAWKLHGVILPILHLGDKAKTRDSKYSLKVLWCKAIASLDRSSKAFDNFWTYDTLPSVSRWLILRLFPIWVFPRLHHANIEARTVYLNQIIQDEIDRLPENCSIRLVSLGSGYDIRCSRLLSVYPERMKAYELDLESVVESKQIILNRLQQRRPSAQRPTLIPLDLNNLTAVQDKLEEIIVSSRNGETDVHTIYISEGVMIYLKKTIPSGLLKLMADISRKANAESSTASFCFADRLEDVPGGDIELAKAELSSHGWDLMDWCPKPGLARHMGVARLRV